MSDLNAKVLEALQAIQANQELLLAQSGLKSNFIQPKADEEKAKTTKKAEPQLQESVAHHAMKAQLKKAGKKANEKFTKSWLAIRKDAGFGERGNIPTLKYFGLQSLAFASVGIKA
jgi:ornithine carbamoyltransferase